MENDKLSVTRGKQQGIGVLWGQMETNVMSLLERRGHTLATCVCVCALPIAVLYDLYGWTKDAF